MSDWLIFFIGLIAGLLAGAIVMGVASSNGYAKDGIVINALKNEIARIMVECNSLKATIQLLLEKENSNDRGSRQRDGRTGEPNAIRS